MEWGTPSPGRAGREGGASHLDDGGVDEGLQADEARVPVVGRPAVQRAGEAVSWEDKRNRRHGYGRSSAPTLTRAVLDPSAHQLVAHNLE